MNPFAHPTARRPAALAAWATAALLSACAGGYSADEALDTVPASATASPEAFTRYAAALPEDEQREPLRVDGVEPPTTETAEPDVLAR